MTKKVSKSKGTLVIHPDDRSTDFLRAVYAGIPNCKVLTGKMSIWEVDLELAKASELGWRVIMLGHGTPHGLLAVGQFSGSAYVVDSTSADYLTNPENIYIWCYASSFVNKHKLRGFSSSMFISEVAEADYCGLPNQSKEAIDIQCEYFCDLVGKVADRPVESMYQFVKNEFGVMRDYCDVASYNHDGLLLFK